uniref:NADH-ubiquinone oxidoreductase chain 4 n=1 Tax=Phrixothrix hirtus TaxID=94779 RepID=A0A0R6C591_PHRHR|nr:NADH dehydrogenase subunit 4 [Phrixothrix hirtus]
MMKFLFFFIFLIFLYFMEFFFFFYVLFYYLVFFFLGFYLTDYYSGISYFFGCDCLSFFMVSLTLWIGFLMILASEKMNFHFDFSSFFIFNLILLMISLMITFMSMNLFIFYLFFEISLIPSVVLILGWGYQSERLSAGLYMFFYTLLASFPMMISIFYVYNNFMVLDFFFVKGLTSSWVFFFMMLVFLVKIPMFFLHLWLPKAHVEAPVSGSMVLAGVMVKLGGYGLKQFKNFFIFPLNNLFTFLISFKLKGGVIISLVCFRQVNFKSLIAYSSVSQKSLGLSGLLKMNFWGNTGCLAMMIGHGLSSSGLFCLINMFYERLNSRSLYIIKGLMNIVPSMTLWWFLFCLSNMSFPPTMNFMGEFMLMGGLVSWCSFIMLLLMFMFFLSTLYSLYLFSYSQYGNSYLGNFSFFNCFLREYLLVFLHWFPLIFMFLIIDYLVI